MKEFQNIDWTSLKRFRQTIENKKTGQPWLQRDLAKDAGMSQSYLARIERGDMTSPNRKFVEAIATSLGMKVVHLLGYLEKRDQETKFPSAVKLTYTNDPRKIYKFTQPYHPRDFKYGDGVLIDDPVEVFCPPQLAKDGEAYAIELPSNTMQPRYHAGDTLYVNPTLRPKAGDDVVLIFEHNGRRIGIVREVIYDGRYFPESYVEDGYAEDNSHFNEIWVMSLAQKIREMRKADSIVSHRPDGVNIPENAKIADYYIEDYYFDYVEALGKNKVEGPFLIDGTGDVETHVVVGSWKSQRRVQQAKVSIKAESIMTANAEVGQASVTTENN